MDFECIFCIRFGEVGGPPGSGNDFIYDHHFGVDPKNGQIERDEQHMDGRVEARVTLFDQQQAFVSPEMGAEHQSAQAAEKRVAVSYAGRLIERSGQVVYVNEAQHIYQNGAAFLPPLSHVGWGQGWNRPVEKLPY